MAVRFCHRCRQSSIYSIFTNSSNLLFSNRNDVTLISFIGMTEDEFRASEYSSLLKLQKEGEYSDEPAGTIVKQNPKAGRTVKEGQKIDLDREPGHPVYYDPRNEKPWWLRMPSRP